MQKIEIDTKIPIVIFKENGAFIAHSPVLDHSACGDTFEEAKKNFSESVEILFEELAESGKLDQFLLELGWLKSADEWFPPVVVAHEFAHVEMSIDGRR